MKTAALTVYAFTLAKLEDSPLSERIELYTALAELAPTPAERRRLAALASELTDIERRHRQLLIDLGDGASS